MFLALQGVLLAVIGTGGTIPIRDETILEIMNSNLSPPIQGWVMWLLVVGGYAAVVLLGLRRRRAAGLPAGSPLIPMLRVVVLAVLLGAVVLLFNGERSINPVLQIASGRAVDRSDRDSVRRRADIRAEQDLVRPTRVRRRGQRGGGAPVRHQRQVGSRSPAS